MDVERGDAAGMAAAIRSSPIRHALVTGLDYWAVSIAVVKRKDPRLTQVLALAREADPDPWRDRFRDLEVWGDRAALARLAEDVDVERQSPMILASLGQLLSNAGGDPWALYQRAMLAHPRDFWLRFRAAVATRDPQARAALFLAAITVRPTSALAYNHLSVALRQQKNVAGAEAAARKAIDLDSKFGAAHANLGAALLDRGEVQGAVAAMHKSVELYPKAAPAHYHLGLARRQNKDLPGAVAAFRKAIDLQPEHAQAHHALAWLLATCPDDRVRDGKRAIDHANTACELTGWKVPRLLGTLAAAHAEAGRFEEAVRYQTRALDDPTLQGDLRTAARQRLELYRQKKPWRDPGP